MAIEKNNSRHKFILHQRTKSRTKSESSKHIGINMLRRNLVELRTRDFPSVSRVPLFYIRKIVTSGRTDNFSIEFIGKNGFSRFKLISCIKIDAVCCFLKKFFKKNECLITSAGFISENEIQVCYTEGEKKKTLEFNLATGKSNVEKLI